MPARTALKQQLTTGLDALALALPDAAVERLLDYIALLEHWNGKFNLTAVREPAAMVTRHLLDSLVVRPWIAGMTLADLGSGAGLPGIPLAIALPQLKVTLVDSNGKKAGFLREAVRVLELPQVEVIQARAEACTGTHDRITARALASLADMLRWGGHLLARDGAWLAFKGRRPDDELAALPPGFRVAAVERLTVPGLDAERHLVVIKRAPRPARQTP